MPLILAIEPDRRQANQLNAMVRGRLHAELVLAGTAEDALAALGDRVPDLILTSALLSPKDECALADRLRVLDGAAAHVQTLTVPVLAPPSPRADRGRGVVLRPRHGRRDREGRAADADRGRDERPRPAGENRRGRSAVDLLRHAGDVPGGRRHVEALERGDEVRGYRPPGRPSSAGWIRS